MDENRNFTSALCPVSAHAGLTAEQAALLDRLNVWLDHPAGRLSRAIWPEDHLKMALEGSPIADFFNTVQLAASGAQVSCAALANSVRGFDENVTVRDVVASYVYSNTLAVLEVGDGGISVSHVDIPHTGKPLAMSGSADLKAQVEAVMRETARGRGPSEIAASHGWDAALVEQIARLYVTHPGVTADGILDKMGV